MSSSDLTSSDPAKSGSAGIEIAQATGSSLTGKIPVAKRVAGKPPVVAKAVTPPIAARPLPPVAAPIVQAPFPVARSAPASPANQTRQSRTPGRLPVAIPPQLPVILPVAPPAATVFATEVQSPDLVAIDNEREPESGLMSGLHRALALLPGWMVSFILHTALLLVLAWFTLNPNSGKALVDLELGGREDPVEMFEFESAMDVNIADLESEAPEVEPAEMEQENPELDGGIDEQLTDIAPFSPVGSDGLQPARTFAPGEGARFFGSDARGRDFVFIVDASSSMSSQYRWEIAVSELRLAINNLTSDQRYVVFLYNSFTHTCNKGKAKLRPASESHKQELFEWLSEMGPDGDTRPWEAVRAGLKLEPDAIFLMSDGELRDETVRRLRIANNKLEKKDKEIPVHTVFLGDGDGGPTMKTIAEQNAGTFKRVDNW